MRTLIFMALLLPVLTGSLQGADEANILVGRWQAETVPTGYWIADRYPDGRYVERRFWTGDTDKPSEIAVVWGRWELKGHIYRSIIDGSNSAFFQRFIGKWTKTKVISVSAKRFDFWSTDGATRYEIPDSEDKPLWNLRFKPPADLRGSNRKILVDSMNGVPEWTNGCAKR